jgi:probable rRNA maturation factor
VLDVEVFGGALTPGIPTAQEIRRLCAIALAAGGIEEGHMAVEFVDPERIAELNGRHRGRPQPTDVLSFPVDEDDDRGPPETRELGDVIICPAHTVDLREAIVHGALHLAGMDHERDDGEMLALQHELLGWDTSAGAAGPEEP